MELSEIPNRPNSSTVGLKTVGIIWLDSVKAERQTCMNNDFDHCHEALVSGQSSKSHKFEGIVGSNHGIPIELQQFLINFVKKRAPKAWQDFNSSLKRQDEAHHKKE